ncbi:MAG: hypothetical protein WBJ21_00170 [Burkholderiaceae bacterium]
MGHQFDSPIKRKIPEATRPDSRKAFGRLLSRACDKAGSWWVLLLFTREFAYKKYWGDQVLHKFAQFGLITAQIMRNLPAFRQKR